MAQYDFKEDVAQLGETELRVKQFVKQGGDDVITLMNGIHFSMVNHAEAACKPLPGTTNSEYEFDIKIAMRDGYENLARVFKPLSSIHGNATVILIHGGGFAIGHPTHVSHYARAVTKLFGTTVFSITYRLTSHCKFPTPSNDTWDALEWIFSSDNSSHAVLGDYSKTAFILGGVSAGGNLAAVTAQKWISEKKVPTLKGVWLGVPWIMERENIPSKYSDLWISREQNAKSFVLNSSTVSSILDAYQPDVLSSDFSPFNNAKPHQGLPPTYFQVCGQDPLRDDGLIYEKVLRDHGVSTKIDIYPGFHTDSLMCFPVSASAWDI
ncbi:alpha/beta hydrolase fold-3 domain-containing protein [Colletotrichum tofieldiae]|nr:alpha/beta hydrolase fold-3 domain-containing protein [Colletotrichum tofieldiae]